MFLTKKIKKVRKKLSHIVLLVLVCLTETVPKHNGPKHNFKEMYVRIRSLNIF